MKPTKQDIICIVVAIVTGVAFGACHRYSVEAHKAEIEPIAVFVTNTPIQTETVRIEPNSKSEAVFTQIEYDVVRVVEDGIPNEVRQSAEKWGEIYNICPELIESLAYEESRFQADAVSSNGECIGICQVNPKWHQERIKRLGVTDLTDIDSNIAVATDYLAELATEFDGDVEYCLMEYNGDKRYKKGIVSRYAQNIVERSAEWEKMHGK